MRIDMEVALLNVLTVTREVLARAVAGSASVVTGVISPEDATPDPAQFGRRPTTQSQLFANGVILVIFGFTGEWGPWTLTGVFEPLADYPGFAAFRAIYYDRHFVRSGGIERFDQKLELKKFFRGTVRVKLAQE